MVWGENAFGGYGVWGGDGEVKGIGGVGASSIDIFISARSQLELQEILR